MIKTALTSLLLFFTTHLYSHDYPFVIEEMASFPYGDHDDYCDSATMALMRFRQGGFLSLKEDYQEDAKFMRKNRTVYY